ncbi:MAG: hypothetical protein R3F56_04805 [Planctomycetota bacterium]
MRTILLPFLGLGLAAQAVEPVGRDDRRDVVELVQGQPVTGRVVNPFDPKEVLLLQGGKRVRVERSRVKSMVTVRDLVTELLHMHLSTPNEANRLQILAEWALSKKLDEMAALFAYRALCADPEYGPAHELLGHRKQGDRWLWKRGDRFMPKAAFDDYISEYGHPLELRSEHWQLRTDAGVERAVDTLLDLERLYLFLFERFGAKLDLYEVLSPVLVLARKDKESFPGWTQLAIPYYHPPRTPEGVYTFFDRDADGPAGRATALFRVGTEALLNRCLAVDAEYPTYEYRLVDWFEIGFGEWIDSQLAGPPGRAVPGTPSMTPERVRLVLEERRYKLPILLQRNVDDNYYDSVTDYKDMDWAYAQAFVAFLMEDPDAGGNADKLLKYAYQAMRKKQGDSSSTFDKAFGARIETLEKPFEGWLRAHAGQGAKPGR